MKIRSILENYANIEKRGPAAKRANVGCQAQNLRRKIIMEQKYSREL